MRERNWWGWGFTDATIQVEPLRDVTRDLFGLPARDPVAPVALESVALPESRLTPPARLADICSTAHRDRVVASGGQASRDVLRRMRGQVDHPPDVVARPRDESDVAAVLEWAADAGAAVVPYGGGTSVVGGVEPRVPDRFAGAITLDMSTMDTVLEVDPVSHAARVQPGATGPRLERQLAEHGMTLRFYPQSFELSTVGGWLATRAGGHFATGPTRIDHLVESIRAISYAGTWQSRRLPGSGAGPSPDALLLGSEGTLGVITEAWLRVRPRPACRASATCWFDEFGAGLDAVRSLAQSGLWPSNLRLIDAGEAARTAGGDGRRSLLLLGFESADEPVDVRMRAALRHVEAHGGSGEQRTGDASSSSDSWRQSFFAMPYLRDALLRLGVLAETFESAVTWDRVEPFIADVTGSVAEALGTPAHVSCRITHAYPDGAAPYFTVLAPAPPGAEPERWDRVKAVAMDAVIGAGGTITHHHAVGRDHRPGYDRQRPEPFAAALRAAKAALDPGGRLNPGVLLD